MSIKLIRDPNILHCYINFITSLHLPLPFHETGAFQDSAVGVCKNLKLSLALSNSWSMLKLFNLNTSNRDWFGNAAVKVTFALPFTCEPVTWTWLWYVLWWNLAENRWTSQSTPELPSFLNAITQPSQVPTWIYIIGVSWKLALPNTF